MSSIPHRKFSLLEGALSMNLACFFPVHFVNTVTYTFVPMNKYGVLFYIGDLCNLFFAFNQYICK